MILKRKFLNILEKMDNPYVTESSIYEYPLLSSCFALHNRGSIYDNKGCKLYLDIHCCKLLTREYDEGNLESYYKRRIDVIEKIKQWVQDSGRFEYTNETEKYFPVQHIEYNFRKIC